MRHLSTPTRQLIIMGCLSAIAYAQPSIACNPDPIESDNRCAQLALCVDVKVQSYCDADNKKHKRFFNEASVEDVTLIADQNENLLVLGNIKWKYELQFIDTATDQDITANLIASGNLVSDCKNKSCDWTLFSKNLTEGNVERTFKYHIVKHKNSSHDIEPKDPTVTIKPTK